MPSNFRDKYKRQLPRPSIWSWGGAVNVVGAFASIIGVYLVFSDWWKAFSADTKAIFFVTYLFVIIVFLVVYIFIKETQKKHRYAQSIYYIHFVNHIIRDHLAGLQLGRDEALSTVLKEIVDAISSAFSIIEGRQCRCSIKEVTKETRPQVVTKTRDSVSKTQSLDTDSYTHFLDENTDFDKVWNGKEGCVRYFKGINLKKMWRKGKYKNSSFQAYGEPQRHDILGFSFVTDWNIPYNCTMVWPIRFIPDHAYWPPSAGATNSVNTPLKMPDIWGFICIDANTSRAFKTPQAAELGALFADALYTLMNQMAYMAGNLALTSTAPNNSGQGVSSPVALEDRSAQHSHRHSEPALLQPTPSQGESR